MDDTWAHRDLPVLDAIVTALEDNLRVNAAQIAAITGIDADDVVRAFYALQHEYTGPMTIHLGGRPESFYVDSVSADARRAVGQWPTAESLIEGLVAGLEQAAERETEPERKTKLRSLAAGLRGFANAVAVNVASQVVGQHVPR